MDFVLPGAESWDRARKAIAPGTRTPMKWLMLEPLTTCSRKAPAVPVADVSTKLNQTPGVVWRVMV